MPASTWIAIAESISPRWQRPRDDVLVIEAGGLERLIGGPQQIGEAVARAAAACGLRPQVAVAPTRAAAVVLALWRPGVTVVRRGGEAAAVAPVPVGILQELAGWFPAAPGCQPRGCADTASQRAAKEVAARFARWGLTVLGEVAALPPDELAARLGQQGLAWQAIAQGRDVGPFVPARPEERFESALELEWPIEGLEPLSFVLTRLLEPLSAQLERRDRGAAVLHVRLDVVPVRDLQRGGDCRSGAAADVRTLQLPAPVRDVRTLRTLVLLDLESHPPAGPIERVAIAVDPTPARVLQQALFARAQPAPEQLATLIARLNALMGADRVGRPVVVDSHRPGAFAIEPFPLEEEGGGSTPAVSRAAAFREHCTWALRRCRHPVPARVSVVGGRPAAVATDRRGFGGGRVVAWAGPWRSSGGCWEPAAAGCRAGGEGARREGREGARRSGGAGAWDRDEWEVALGDGAAYRMFQDRTAGRWFIEAILD